VKDYDNPIKPTFENEFEFPLIQGFTMEKHMKVGVNEADDYTSIFYPSDKKDFTYYSVNSVLHRDQAQLDPR
jgi:hypothetical protein